MNWIKVRTNLVRDGRVVWLATKLHTHPVFVCGALCWLWSCADEQTTDGKLHGYTPEYIDQQVNLPGFTLALTELTKDGKPSPWASITTDYIGVCEFSKHNGKTAKKRAQAATRASRFRNAPSVTPALRNAHLVKSKSKAEEEQNIASLQACVSSQAGAEVSSLWDALPCLLAVGMERKAAAKLASDPRACKARMEWAVPKVVAAMRSAKGCPNPAGYLRRLLTSTDGPAPPEPSGPIPFAAPPIDRNQTSNTIRTSLGVKK